MYQSCCHVVNKGKSKMIVLQLKPAITVPTVVKNLKIADYALYL